ncbi:MAG: DUF1275 domain-containing protein [Treponema sp.]|nr:DUF1275 domain-containing protein [Treponema sp.]
MRKELLFRLWIFFLMACAGFANSLVSLSYFMRPAHHTGNVFLLAESIFSGDVIHVIKFFLLIFSFFVGSVIGGFLFSNNTKKNKKYYWILPLCFGFCFLVLQLLEKTNFPLYAITLILGVQNSMPIYVSGAKVRSSHITGNLTDSAFILGTAFREKCKPRRTGTLLLTIISFLIGSIFGIAISNDFAYMILGFVYIGVSLWFFFFLKND